MPAPRDDSDANHDAQLVDTDLVVAAQGGDREAYSQLVTRWQRRAAWTAYRLLGHRDDALDVSQEALIRAWEHLSELQDPRRFGAWLMRTVTNLSLNYRRDHRNDPVALGQLVSSAHNGQDGSDMAEIGALLDGAHALPDRMPARSRAWVAGNADPTTSSPTGSSQRTGDNLNRTMRQQPEPELPPSPRANASASSRLDSLQLVPNATDGPATRLWAAELQAAAREALKQLPQKQRAALTLFALDGLSQHEVARQMATSVEAVKWHVFQARKRLREVLAPHLEPQR